MSRMIKEHEDMMKCSYNARGYSSLLRGVSLTEENIELAKRITCEVYGVKRSETRIVYRGPRTKSDYFTLKSDATHFDLYLR